MNCLILITDPSEILLSGQSKLILSCPRFLKFRHTHYLPLKKSNFDFNAPINLVN